MTSDPEYFVTAPAPGAVPAARPDLLQPQTARARRSPWRITVLVICWSSAIAGLLVLAALPVLLIVKIGRFLDSLPF